VNGLEAAIIGLVIAVPQSQLPNIPDRSTECLALNMYHESRGQGIAGELAVTAVVLNRVNDKRYPNTICEVVEQGPTRASWQDPKIRFPVKNRCQFSWFCDGKSDTPRNKKIYNRMYNLADAILGNEISFLDITGGATHYHADYVLPAWAKTKTKTVEIQDHIFYRWEK
jgi:spore germination cell wall hydrolase CwlJ-like protein